MFCHKCGTSNPDNAKFCINCAADLTASAGTQASPAPAQKKSGGKGLIIGIIAALLIVVTAAAAIFILPTLGKDEEENSKQEEVQKDTRKDTYLRAQELLEDGDYEEAAELFEELDDYKDSEKYALYAEAMQLMEDKDYEDAIELFDELGTFKDSQQQAEIAAEALTPPVIEEPVAVYNGSEVTIRFYHTMGAKLTAVLDTYIAEFNRLYPNIHIEYATLGNYDDVRNQISTEIAVGNQPHIAYCYPEHVALYNTAKAVSTLDPYINSTGVVTRADGTTEIMGLTEEQKADFIAGYYNEGAQFGDGLMYTLPMSKSTEVLYYNKTFFDQHGLKVPETWEEMEQVCAQIKAIDPDSIPLGYDSTANWFITMCEQYGSPYTSATGEHFLFDNGINHNFVKMLHEWYQKGYLTTQDLYGAYTSGLFTTLDGTRSYMSIGSSAGATYQRPAKDRNGQYPFEVGIATIPQVNPSNPKVISQGPSLCIFQKANEQEVLASWLFVKFLTTNVQFQTEFAMASGYVPVLKSAAQNDVYARFLAMADGGNYIAALSAKVCMEQQAAYFTPPAFVGSDIARVQVGTLMSKCLATTGNIDSVIDEAFGDAIEECRNGIR